MDARTDPRDADDVQRFIEACRRQEAELTLERTIDRDRIVPQNAPYDRHVAGLMLEDSLPARLEGTKSLAAPGRRGGLSRLGLLAGRRP